MDIELKPPTTTDEWSAYHSIRRRVLFELRGNGDAYDAEHPDETRPGHYPLVLWVDGAMVGVVRVDIDGARAIFRRVAILDHLQRRGLGRQLLALAEQFARLRDCTRIESYVDVNACGFYERCGFAYADDQSGRRASPLMIKFLD